MERAAVERDLAGEVLDAMATAFLLVDAEWRLVRVNALGERVLRAPATDLVGRHLADCLRASQLGITARWLQRAARSGRPLAVETFDPELDTWFEVRAVPTSTGMGVHLLDITQRHRAQEEVRRTAAHLQLLDAVGTELGGPRDAEDAVGRLAAVLVPQLADWCVVTLVDEDGRLRDVGAAHVETALVPVLREHVARRARALTDASPVRRAVASGEVVVCGEGAGRPSSAGLLPGRARDLLDRLAPASGVAVPVRLRGRVLGVLSLHRGEDRPVLTDDEVATAVEVAARAAQALDGASAYRRAQQAIDRLRLLTEVGEALGREADEEGVGALAALAVPLLGDCAVVSLVGEDGVLRDLGVAHRDPAQRDLVAAYAAAWSTRVARSPLLSAALATGRPATTPGVADEALAAALDDPALLALAHRLDAGAFAAFPLLGRGQVLGLLVLGTTRERGPHTSAELDTAGEVARRAGAALDAARLLGQQRHLSEALQRSMLTAPLVHDAVEVAVRYAPAAAGAQVGGDWYDAFLQPSGSLVITIGDVMGHDTAAAAAMGQVRGLLRGIAHHGGAGPAGVLVGLDRAIEGLRIATTATCLVGRLEQTDVERGLGLTRMRWASAGHPPPLVVGPDGGVSVVEDPDPDLVLGVDAESERHEREVVLAAGSTVLLYTDGLVERRDRSLDEGVAALVDALGDVGDLPLEELCDAVLARLVPAAAPDDVALVAVRLRRPPAGEQVP